MKIRPSGTVAVLACVASIAAFLALPATATSAPSVGPRTTEVELRGAIVIESDADFTKENGVRAGNGSMARPYVISGWSVPTLVVRDTHSHVVIRDNVVEGQLILNWNGHGLDVHNNDVGDLRVNQNVKRHGEPTGGRIHHNVFDVVGQLRHWGGLFDQNVVGSEEILAQDPAREAINLDGFHRGRLVNNTVFGYVDFKLHGHYHGSSYKGKAHGHQGHYEVDEYGIPLHTHGTKHVKRYNVVTIQNNTIYSEHEWALRYYDTNHDGDDKTAASETDKFLNSSHVHFTRVNMRGNHLIGAALMVDVFNPRNDNHWGNATGRVKILGNAIEISQDATEPIGPGRHGIHIREARFIDLTIKGNQVAGPRVLASADPLSLEKELYRGAGIRLDRIEDGRVWVLDNSVSDRQYGVHASDFHTSVTWTVRGLRTSNVKQDVHSERVPNAPKG